MPTFLPATVTDRIDWAPGLFSLRLDRVTPFEAGQFLTLTTQAQSTRHTRRAYSVASAPHEPLEFLVVRVPDGTVSPMLHRTAPGDRIFVSDSGKGRLTLARVPPGRSLWLVASGTGIAPFRSMLREGSVFQRFQRVIVIYGARHREHVAYRDELERLTRARPDELVVQALISRQPPGPADLPGRVTERLADGTLEAAVGSILGPESRVMLCGNPAMIADMLELLATRGLQRHSPRDPGQILTEKYW